MVQPRAGRYPAYLGLLLLVAAALLPPILAPGLLAAQPPPGPEEEEPPDLSEDPGGSVDPAVPEEEVTLGQDLLPYEGDPLALDSPDDYTPEELGTGPSIGADRDAAVAGCAMSGPLVRPIKIAPGAKRYFSFRGRTQVLVGVSADNGCHLELGAAFCNFTNYKATLRTAQENKLNKLRLWVALSGEKLPNNVPFARVTDASGTYWRLDQRNPLFFNRLRQVVAFAQSLDMMVEVTFFAPFEGGVLPGSPWGGGGRAPNASGQVTPVRFSSADYFVIFDRRGTPEALQNERMRTYQKKVIEWTVRELWCFDNVYWEIANEPEGSNVHPLAVAEWQREMIRSVMAEEAKYPRLAAGGHLIAVQPFTRRGAEAFLNDPNVDIINGHYTNVTEDPKATLPDGIQSRLDLGALSLIQIFGNQPKIFGFNETKITPLGGKTGTRSHLNGSLARGTAEPARAEAWEFLFDQGATYDHFGYLSTTSGTPAAVRGHMKVLKAFFDSLPLADLTPARPPAWVDIGPYPHDAMGLDPSRLSQRYWAALQTRPNLPRLFLLYLHHSTLRCGKRNGDSVDEAEFPASGCLSSSDSTRVYLSRNGYDARVWPIQKYQDRLRLKNLAPTPCTFSVKWIVPATGSESPGSILRWDPANGGTCNGGICEVVSPLYSFDTILKVQQQSCP
jgi:hypothetical protein